MFNNETNQIDEEVQILSYKYCLCKNGDEFLKSTIKCEHCKEYYHSNCFNEFRLKTFKCFVCSKVEKLIQQYKIELETRKTSQNSETIQEERVPISISSDFGDFNEPSLSLEEDESKKLENVKSRIKTLKSPNKIKLIRDDRNILKRTKRLRQDYTNLRKKYIFNNQRASNNVYVGLPYKYRDKGVQDLVRLFKNRSKDNINEEELKNLCKNIENQLYQQIKDRKKYIQKIRLIKNNLINVKNETFYKKILTGEIKPEDLANMEARNMASDKVIEERLNEKQKELKRIQDHSNELNATKARIRLFGAINKGLYALNEDDCKEFLGNQAKSAPEPIETVVVNSNNGKVFSVPSKKMPDKIQKFIDQDIIKSPTASLETEQLSPGIRNENKLINDFSASISNKRKNDSLDTSSNDCKRPKLETASSDSSESTKLNDQSNLKDDSNNFSRNSSQTSERSTSSLNEEKNDEKRRKEKNLIITSLHLNADRTHDRSIVEAIFKYIHDDINKIQSVRRINRNSVRVELRDKNDTKSILQNARNLRNSRKFCKVFIKTDLTYDEQLIEKRNRLNSKYRTSGFYFVIENNELVKYYRKQKKVSIKT